MTNPQAPAPEPNQSPSQPAEGKVIQGAPTKPGDKPEAPERPIFSGQQNAPAQPNTDQTPPAPTPEPAVTSQQAPPPSPPATPATALPHLPPDGQRPDGNPLDAEEKVFSALGYVGILALLPLLARRDSEYCQHHGRQALVIAAIFIFLWLFGKLLIPFGILIAILQLVAIIGGFVFAYQGKWFRVPVIYNFSLKLKMINKPKNQ